MTPDPRELPTVDLHAATEMVDDLGLEQLAMSAEVISPSAGPEMQFLRQVAGALETIAASGWVRLEFFYGSTHFWEAIIRLSRHGASGSARFGADLPNWSSVPGAKTGILTVFSIPREALG